MASAPFGGAWVLEFATVPTPPYCLLLQVFGFTTLDLPLHWNPKFICLGFSWGIYNTHKLLIYTSPEHYAQNQALSYSFSHPVATAACRGGHDCAHFTNEETKAQGSKQQSCVEGLENQALGRQLCKVGRARLGGLCPFRASSFLLCSQVAALNQRFIMWACGWGRS